MAQEIMRGVRRSWWAPALLRVLAVLLVLCLAGCVPAASTDAEAPTTNPEAAVGAEAPTTNQTAERVPLVVFGAGSLIVPFDALEAAFEAQHPEIDVRSEYHGSIQVIRHATELHERIDVVATADAALIPMLMTGATDPETGRPYVDWYIRFASNRLALAYHAESKYAAELTPDNWPEVLARPDVRVGLSDPRFDAAGYRAFMSVVLEQQRKQAYTYWPTLFRDQFTRPVTLFMDDALATVTVPEVLETRPGSHILLRGGSNQLLALLESGDVDYAWEYESVIRQHGLQMLSLPDDVNLGSPAHEADYSRVEVRLDFQRFASVKPVFRGERIGYGITIPASAAHPAEAAQFIAFLLGPEGRVIMESHHHPMFEVPLASGYEQMPVQLQALCEPGAGP